MTDQTPLAINEICKSYDHRTVLDHVNLTLNPGEIFGLIGLNGAGKTTLIKIMLNLANADSGSVAIYGKPPSSVEARAGLSYLPEKFQPSRYLVGMEYLELALAYYGKKLDKEQARTMAAALDLDPVALNRRVGTYSKGMGQKLGLVGAFLVDIPFLILDEPMSGLDPSARIKLKDQLLLLKQAGRTIFFSSHILSDIDEICERIGIIHGGRLFFIGTPAEFKRSYNQSSLERAFLASIGERTAA